MSLKKGKYPYPDENIFMIFGGANEHYLSNHSINIDVDSEDASFDNITNIFNKMNVLTAVAENKEIALKYFTDIMPDWWKNYSITSLSELKTSARLSYDVTINKNSFGELWLVKTKDLKYPYVTVKTEHHNLDIIKTLTNEYFNSEVFEYAILVSHLTKTIKWLQQIKTGNNTEEERFVFSSENKGNKMNMRTSLEIYLDELYASLSESEKEKILKHSIVNNKGN